MKIKFIIPLLFFTILFVSCEKEKSEPAPKGKLSLGIESSAIEGLTTIKSTKNEEATTILVSLKNASDNYVLNTEKLTITKVGDEYFSENVELSAGNYTVEDFMVLNDIDSVIYLTPKSGSEFEDFVNTPLPHSFDVSPDQTTEVVLEVIPADFGTLEQFGYASFTFDILKSLVLQPNATTGKDVFVHSYYADKNYGDHALLQSLCWTINGGAADLRSYLEFDLSEIPAGSEIVKANLSLYEDHTSIQPSDGHSQLSGSNASYIKKVTSKWDESTITWNNQPSVSDSVYAILPKDTVSTQDYPNIDITGLVQEMIDNSDQNFGFVIGLIEEIPYRAMYFASSDNQNVEKRPKLVISYK